MRARLVVETMSARFLKQSGALWATVCIGAWWVAAVCTRWWGIWLPIGGLALVLGALTLPNPTIRAALRPRTPHVLLGLGAGALMVGATWVLYPPVIELAPGLGLDVGRILAEVRATPTLVTVLALPPIVLAEEVVWRGVVQGSLARRGPVLATLGAGALYGAVLIPTGLPALVLAGFVCGLAWSALRALSGSLLPSVLAHLAWSMTMALALPLP